MEFPTSSSQTVTDTNRNVLPSAAQPFSFQLKHEVNELNSITTTTTTTTGISSPALTPPTPVSPREPQSPDGHTSVSSTGSSDTISDLDQSQIRSSLVVEKSNVACAGGDADDEEELIPEVSFDANSDFNLHFFDTPEDSSTQGGFSDPGSIESESLDSPTPPAAHQTTASGNCLTEAESLQLLGAGVDDCKSFFESSSSSNNNNATLHANCSSYAAIAAAKTTAKTSARVLGAVANFAGCGVGVGSSIATSSSTLGLGHGGGALYAHSSNNQYNPSHSSSSSSGCSSTSSSSAGGGGGGSGSGRSLGGTSAGASLGVEHFIGSNNLTASAVSSTTAATVAAANSSLAHVKLQQDQQQFAIADSNSNNVSKSFVPCKVCGDKASGYHYGVTSCEGCKGFFRRSIQKQIEYRCLRDGKCLVIRLNRNRCQYCRFKKCLSAGMSRDSVRYGRVPKRSRELNGTPSSTDDPNIRVSTPGTPNTPQTPQMCSVASPAELGCTAQLSADAEVPGTAAELSVYDVIVCVSQAHRIHCTYTEEQTRELMRRPISVPQNGIATSIAETLEFQKIWLWQQYAARITPGVQRIVEFAKRVPGFCDFTQDDQLILIKLGFFEVWLSHVARMINDSTLTFDDGAYLTRQQLEILYDSDFVISLINYANTVNAYGLSDTEIGLFSATVLLASDRSGISEHKVISRARERIAEALRVQIVRSRPGSTQALQLMPALEAKIPELRALGAKHFSHLDWLRMNWTKLRLPPLFAEIFDIPKTEDDL